MPRLSMWKPHKGNDYRFLDGIVREQLEVAGVSAIIHKYIGPDLTDSDSDDPSELSGVETNEMDIQDMLLLSNRDSKFDKDLYELKGHYMEQDNDFDLTQFSAFLTNDVFFLTFHLNGMVERMGRKLMNRDVIELPNLIEEYPLDADSPPIPKFYKVEDGSRSSEGFSQTWWPHLWRVKISPLTDSREFKPILDRDYEGTGPLRELISTYGRKMELSDASRDAAEKENPDGTWDDGHLLKPESENALPQYYDELNNDQRGTDFPSSPKEGDYFLREDYDPAVLYKREGNRWIRISHRKATWEEKTFQGAAAANNDKSIMIDGKEVKQRQGLSDAIRPEDG